MTQPESKQLAILRFVYEKQLEKGYPPTVREIGEGVGLSSSSTVHGHLNRLQKKGLLHKDPDKPRALEVTPAGIEALGVTTRSQNMMPVLDEHEAIPASNEDSDYIVDYFPVPENLVRFDGDLFMLRLRGNAMLNIGMLDGDFVIVRRQNDADNGDIVVARDEAGQPHIKRLFREADAYRLQPENDNMTPIIVRDLTILGKVVGLYRDAIY
ncbi:transcriptional repressor LexA [Weissella cibaria]|uniref:transcriptional repressor LexA n=1 Tax=Weissella cibaria TaxID=137591 RepID=UPI001C1F9778|nr:transcriptional repressor LexA [Weissella cibaria]MBU7543568.1 transcriptional repressor LexA [Weissella cibaria]MCV3316800.1 transcriptional repressor LexA [Weissella cibaria]